MEKNRLEKVRKHVFYKHMNILSKNGEKTWEKIFPETHSIRTRISLPKNGGEKTREKIFRETHVNRLFYRRKKSTGKSAKTRLFINI